MTLREALVSLAVTIAAGALIGAEREQARAGNERAEFGGIRTFPIVAMFGAIGALLSPALGVWIVVGGLVALSALLVVSYLHTGVEDFGLSTEVAALVTYGLGALAAAPGLLTPQARYVLVAACSAIVMALLALKRPLHGFVAKVSRDDVYATTRFVLLSAVVLPLLPNRTYGPLDVINPFKIGLMVALVAAVSFAGYVATRVTTGQKGLFATGLLGGLVSSRRVAQKTTARLRRSAQSPSLRLPP